MATRQLPLAGAGGDDAARRRGSSPFRDVLPALAVAAVALLAAAAWGLVDGLPGGRWMVVHLLTLGVITPLVLAFTQHFGRTLTRSPADPARLAVPAGVAGALVLTGLTSGVTWVLALGGALLIVLVLGGYRQLRRMRKDAVGARFGWIVRLYERAHGAFVHGALLGILLGTGVLPGSWYVSARLAHLHVNILGWAGITLLATLVFFGPTIVRARIADGVEDRSAAAIRRGATGLTVGVLLLLATGIGGTAGTVLRLLAAVGIGLMAWAVTVVSMPVARAAASARRSASWGLVLGAAVWFPVATWADVLLVATGAWRHLTAVGLAVLAGVLGPAMLATATHVLPMTARREVRMAVIARVERGAGVRAIAWNAGVVAVVLAATGLLADPVSSGLVRSGWMLMGAVLVTTVALVVLPVRAPTAGD